MLPNDDTKDWVYEFTPDDLKKVLAPQPRGVHKDIQFEFSLIEAKVKKIIATQYLRKPCMDIGDLLPKNFEQSY